jgi:molybdopterin/thiamine biosynthesis adenylyltransferase
MVGPTAEQLHWWEDEELSIEAEEGWFAEAGLDFRLDQELFDEHGVVVFRGELRLGDQKAPASVHYPPAYAAGAHPTVVAPDLGLGRHQDPTGALCLDHPVFGETNPMYGAEAVERAERLWNLWENDRDQLAREEADVPDPRANYYAYEPGSAVALPDVDVSGFNAGYVRFGAHGLRPFRAGVVQVRTSEPAESTLSFEPNISPFIGSYEINGTWTRVPEAPPATHEKLEPWVKEHYADRINEVIVATEATRKLVGRPDLPAVIGFVYPDEGPNRGETHDAWLFLVIHPNGKGQMAHAFHLRSDERWLRQPQLRPLEEKRVTIIGIGALGSPLTDLLAKAGVGNLSLLDYDIYALGNRVRHQLDLVNLGESKARAMASRVSRVNPWTSVDVCEIRVGAAIHGSEAARQQEVHDVLLEDFASRDLLVNTTANVVTGHFGSRMAHAAGTPILHAWVSAGAWGGRILLQRPGDSGCTECLALHQKPETAREGVEVPKVADDPEVQEVQERGCADATFTGPGFELAAAAAAAARVAVQSLLEGDGYPLADFDLVTLNFREADAAMPTAIYSRLPIHPDCTICN